MSPQEGDVDQGYFCRKVNGPAEVWESPKGGYTVYLQITEQDWLYTNRKDREDAYALFNTICDMLNLSG